MLFQLLISCFLNSSFTFAQTSAKPSAPAAAAAEPAGETPPAPAKPSPPPEFREDALAKATKIYGTIAETGLAQGTKPAISNFWYERPETFAVRYTKPESAAGISGFIEPKIIRIIFPSTKGGIVIRNAPAVANLIKSTIMEPGAGYGFSKAGIDPKTGAESISFRFAGEGAMPEGSWTLDKEFSYPVKYELSVLGTKYKREFTQIQFNGTKIPSKPRNFVPIEVEATDWDLSSRPYKIPEIDPELDLFFFAPNEMLGLKLEKYIRQKGPVPAYAAVYRDPDGHFLLLIFHVKNKPASPIPNDFGIPFRQGFKNGMLLPGPLLSFLSFADGRTQYLLIGNYSLPMLIEASSLIKANPKPSKVEPPAPPDATPAAPVAVPTTAPSSEPKK